MPFIRSFSKTSKVILLFLSLVLFLVGIWLISGYKILAAIGGFLLVDNLPVEAVDAIVVLQGSVGPERVLKAFELYQKGYSRKILFGSGYRDEVLFSRLPPDFVWQKGGVLYQESLLSLGVPESALVVVNTYYAYDTAHELKVIADYCQEVGIKKLALVSSASHSRRVDLIWQRVGGDIENYTVAAVPEELNEWWKKGRIVREVGYEYAALLKEGIRRIRNPFS